MGIKVKKKWLAAHDNRVRDTHAELDGQEVDADEPFEVDGMQIMYPGDPSAPPEMVYNCRCTLIYVYPEYEQSLEQVQETAEAEELPTMRATASEHQKTQENEGKQHEITVTRLLLQAPRDTLRSWNWAPVPTQKAEAIKPHGITRTQRANGIRQAACLRGRSSARPSKSTKTSTNRCLRKNSGADDLREEMAPLRRCFFMPGFLHFTFLMDKNCGKP